MEQAECSKMRAHKIQTLGNYPEESIQHLDYGKSLKSRRFLVVYNLKQSLKKIQSSITHMAQYVGK